ncbi:hypothetical protein ANAPC5_01376 [Anaplasma phagocytophilum]|nr:hypothetical protein ANAPC5_01376 [Anaplasma phagocytophilum]
MPLAPAPHASRSQNLLKIVITIEAGGHLFILANAMFTLQKPLNLFTFVFQVASNAPVHKARVWCCPWKVMAAQR